MKSLIEPLMEIAEFGEIKQQIQKAKGVFQVSGCIDSQKLHLIKSLSDGFSCKIIVTYSEVKARGLLEEYKFFDKNVLYYPAKDVIFFQSDIHGNLLTKERLVCRKELFEKKEITLITTIDGFMDRIPLENILLEAEISIKTGETLDLEELKKNLILCGYEKNYQVEAPGQFALRGGILDIFPLTDENPYRIEMWDEEVDSIRSFDVSNQRSIENLEEVVIFPVKELVMSKEKIAQGLEKIKEESKRCEEVFRKEFKTEEAHRLKTHRKEFEEELTEFEGTVNIDSYTGYFFQDTVSFLDYFKDKSTLVFLDEPLRLEEKARAVEKEFQSSMEHRLEKGYILPGQTNFLFSPKEIFAKLESTTCLGLETLSNNWKELKIKHKFNISAKSVNPYNNSFELLIKDLTKYKKEGYRVLLLSGSRSRAERLAKDLFEEGLNSYYSLDLDKEIKAGEVMVSFGKLQKGFEYPLIRFVVISESDVFGGEKKKRKKRGNYEGKSISSFNDLHIGDYVVHENHGLGIYKGIEKVEVDKVIKDYMKIEYASNGNLYIPATQLNLIQKYADSDAKKPKLNKLGSQEWNKTKTRVRSAVRAVAKDLVELYAKRQEEGGFPFGKDTLWQQEFEDTFPYEETNDQLMAIEATKKDMESTKIMDRLVCGDVGYGKTEIAIRAAFKAVQDGKQVVYLVPTTILAQQHYNTFVQRLKDFPVRIDLMCRFRTPSEQKRTVEDLKKGMVDILVGTHRVLSKDMVFKDLGLLIVDEEQRFGVTHKEKIKKMRHNIDVLTLTATPIPRTLHMSLVGIRDMSVLEEPPRDRLPIQTYVMEFDEEMVREAINRELARDGQVYYVYNRVSNIQEIADSIQKLVPEANVAYAHGQMREHQLEKIMYGFIHGEIDVLVSTTIIETGLDISNVNTMIIHDADQLGLSQLYQLRGRVGRSNRTSYAFLMYKRNKVLKEIAEKRLHAIREFTDLGSGFKIAMKDLEIRGAGNLLGEQQHGHMEAVGYDLYCKMLNEAVKSIKGTATIEDLYETSIDIDVNAHIPVKYISNEIQKLDIYKRIAAMDGEEEQEEMLEELIDRFGEPPKPVMNLLEISTIKNIAHKAFVTEISQKSESIRFIMYEKADVEVTKIPDFLEIYDGQMKFSGDAIPSFTYTYLQTGGKRLGGSKPKQTDEELLKLVKDIVKNMCNLRKNLAVEEDK